MPDVRELSATETGAAHVAMVELRPKFPSREHFIHQINAVQRQEGYRLVASFDEAAETAVAVAGFRTGHNLAWGSYLYVDDLITLPPFRSRGHAGALMRWLFDEARRLRCDELHLDSGTHRHEAHRFYFKHDLAISSFHFDSGPLRG
jgi:GNAT superfamily N-acetyltransferase